MRRLAPSLALLLCALAPGFAHAQEKPKPEVKGVSVLALRAGQTATVLLYGENLEPTAVTPKLPLTATLGEVKATEGDDKKRGAKQVAVELQVPADCPPDLYDLTLVHAGDVKAVARVAVVAPAAQELEVKRPNATFAQAMPLPGPDVAVTGALLGDTPDIFRFDAKAGETWEITLLAGRAGSSLDPVLRLRDRRLIPLALSAGDDKKDRQITFRVPADGPYFVELTDAEARGGAGFLYRLVVRRKPS